MAVRPHEVQKPPMASVHSLAGYQRWRKSPTVKTENYTFILKVSSSPMVPSASWQPSLQVPGIYSFPFRSSASVSSALTVPFTLGMLGWGTRIPGLLRFSASEAEMGISGVGGEVGCPRCFLLPQSSSSSLQRQLHVLPPSVTTALPDPSVFQS